ncbi:hypothetical protein [Bradyrhizobium sp. 8-10B]|uniref:hypothetical protein n=1 Tax=Bradyrhizobium sp. 8-10B TaxID=3344579 RepID=UPI0035C1FA33
MNQHDAPAPTSGRQMSLIFEPSRVDGMSDAERAKVVLTLAQILAGRRHQRRGACR